MPLFATVTFITAKPLETRPGGKRYGSMILNGTKRDPCGFCHEYHLFYQLSEDS